jgi:hypothetical protein
MCSENARTRKPHRCPHRREMGEAEKKCLLKACNRSTLQRNPADREISTGGEQQSREMTPEGNHESARKA